MWRNIRAIGLFAATLPFLACDCDGGLLNVSARLVVEPASIDFGEVAVGGMRVRSLSLSNEGTALLTITRFELLSSTSEIVLASPAPQTVPPGAPLQINFAYEPSNVGEDTAVLLLASDDGSPERRVEIRGEGVIGGVGISHDGAACEGQEGSIDFGRVEPGQAALQTVTLTGIGTAPITILSTGLEAGTSAEFEIDALAAPMVLAPDATLTVEARYRPADGGADSGAFVITTDLLDMPTLRIPVCGAGVAPAVCGRPVPLDFGRVAVGATPVATFTLESCGLLPVELTGIQLTGDAALTLSMSPTTPRTLAPGETVSVELSLDATTTGTKRANIEVSSTAPGSPHVFPVIAEVATPCDLLVAPSRVVYPAVAAGANDVKEVLVANYGAANCTLTRIAIASGAEFSVVRAPTLPFALGPGVGETIAIRYAPTSTGAAAGVLEVDGGSIQRVDLIGNPEEVEGCAVALSPSLVQFGSAAVGTSVPRAVRVTSIGGDACRIRSVRLQRMRPEFVATTPVPGIVLPGLGTDVLVSYRPTSSGSHFDVLDIEVGPLTGGMTNVHSVGLFGAAADARVCVNPMTIDFGTVAAGTTVTRTVSIGSCGGANLNLRSVMRAPATSSTFQLTARPVVPQDIAAGGFAAPTLTVSYSPQNAGPHFGQIDVVSSDVMNPVVAVNLTGNWAGGCARVLDCSPTSVDFGLTDVGIHKFRNVVCRNAGTDPVTITSATAAGSPAITAVAQTPVTLDPGDVWSAELRYSPTMAQPASATLTLNTNACVAPNPVAIAGVGRDVIRPDCIPPTTFSPQVKWSWTGSNVEPTFRNVWMTPLVANLTDDNADGRVDENDVPEVIFTTFDEVPISDPTTSRPGVLRVVSGDTGVERFSVTAVRFAESAQLAIGDLDGDGYSEIVGSMWVETPPGTGTGGFQNRYSTGNLVALDRFGNVLWVSDPWTWPTFVLWNASAPYLVDLDGDGFSEIVLGPEVFNHQGRRLWTGTGSYGLAAGGGPHAIAVDIDLDGVPEVLAGDTAYRADGTILWRAQVNGRNIGEGGVSVGMLNPNDPFPQIALDAGSALYVLNHLGVVQWTFGFTDREPSATLPVIADFDGDGDADVAVADGAFMRAFTGTGGNIFTAPVMDTTCCAGISAFDFEGDGAFELLLHDFGNIYAYRGATGAQIYSAPRVSPTNLEIPIVADIDNDRRAEVVVALYGSLGGGGGVVAYSNVGNSWVAAPRIWNQQAYHVINVSESGAIPRIRTPIPQAPKVFRGTIADCQP